MDIGFGVDVGNAVSSFVWMSGGWSVEGGNCSSSESLGRRNQAFGTGRRQKEGVVEGKKGKWENWSGGEEEKQTQGRVGENRKKGKW